MRSPRDVVRPAIAAFVSLLAATLSAPVAAGRGRLLVGPARAQMRASAVMALSRDGRTLVVGGGDYSLQIWDLSTKRRVGLALRAHSGPVNAVAVSDDGKLVASGGGQTDGRVILWRRDGRRLAILGGKIGQVRALAFSPDAKLLASGFAGATTYVWDVAKRKRRRAIAQNVECGGDCSDEERVVGVAFFSNRLLAVGIYNKVELFHALTGKRLARDRCGDTCGDDPKSMALSKGRKWLALAHSNGCVKVISRSGWCRALVPKTKLRQAGASVAFLPGGKTLLVHEAGGRFARWSVRGGRLGSTTTKSTRGAIALRPDGTMVTLVGGNAIKVGGATLALSGGAAAARAPAARVVAAQLRFSADGKLLQAVDARMQAARYELSSGKLVGKISRWPRGFSEQINSAHKFGTRLRMSKKIFWKLRGIATQLDGQEMCCGGDCTLPWVARSKTATISADRKVIAYVSRSNLELVGVKAATLRALRKRAAEAVVGFGDDSSRWLVVYKGALWVFDLDRGKRLGPFKGLARETTALALAAGLLATADKSGEVRVWSLASRKTVLRFSAAGGGATSLAFAPNAKRFAVGSRDGSVRLYRLP